MNILNLMKVLINYRPKDNSLIKPSVILKRGLEDLPGFNFRIYFNNIRYTYNTVFLRNS